MTKEAYNLNKKQQQRLCYMAPDWFVFLIPTFPKEKIFTEGFYNICNRTSLRNRYLRNLKEKSKFF